MKTESEVKEQIAAYNDLLMRSESMEEVRRNQGILFALNWVISKDEEKQNEQSEDDTDESDE